MATKLELVGRTFKTIKEEGFRVCAYKIVSYSMDCLMRSKSGGDPSPEKTCMDVLFINGCFLPHPSRYRVTHQREQMSACGIMSNEVYFDKIDIKMVTKYRVFIFYRCVYTEEIGKFIEAAKKLNKVVLFDVDDLVIDKKYTDKIKFLDTMSEIERKEYDSGVERMGKTLRLCDAAITTTERLAKELGNYVPKVYINRNVASDEMVLLSKKVNYKRDELTKISMERAKCIKKLPAWKDAVRNKQEREGVIRMGYFSGSITHNDDVEIIIPVIKRVLKEHPEVQLHIVGELDVPAELNEFKSQIVARPFVDWKELPSLIGSVDINLAPLVNNIFNEAKSENKWVEAALVKVPTVASKVGAFDIMMEDGVTGLLCTTEDEWCNALEKLIKDESYRNKIADQAYNYCLKNCTSIYASMNISKIFNEVVKPNILFLLPSVETSGGVLVVAKHCTILQDAGYDVTILNEDTGEDSIEVDGHCIPVISVASTDVHMAIDKAVASLWSTCGFLCTYAKIRNRYYLVQGYETDFYENGQYFRIAANQTYHINQLPVTYLTISKWCKNWLNNDYDKECRFAPNGLDTKVFSPSQRDYNTNKIRILIEGNCEDAHKNVDESFKIVDKLDKNKYEIWFMSYLGKPKQEYYFDKFLHKVPHNEVPDVYRQCHILLKSSILESFSYPPLEMMATGGQAVVVPNDGNVEYLVDGENCSFYQAGDIDGAVAAIEKICNDSEYREKLYKNGIATANSREWDNIRDDILNLYEAL